MEEERRPMDPTRRLLRVFGVTVTNFEERAAAALAQADTAASVDELLGLAMEIVDLTNDLNARLRETTDHVLTTQAEVLSDLRAKLQQARGVEG